MCTHPIHKVQHDADQRARAAVASPAVQVQHLALADVLHQLPREREHLVVVGDAAVDDGAVVEAQAVDVHDP